MNCDPLTHLAMHQARSAELQRDAVEARRARSCAAPARKRSRLYRLGTRMRRLSRPAAARPLTAG